MEMAHFLSTTTPVMDQVSNFTLCDISKVSDSYVRSYVSTLSRKSNFCLKTHKMYHKLLVQIRNSKCDDFIAKRSCGFKSLCEEHIMGKYADLE